MVAPVAGSPAGFARNTLLPQGAPDTPEDAAPLTAAPQSSGRASRGPTAGRRPFEEIGPARNAPLAGEGRQAVLPPQGLACTAAAAPVLPQITVTSSKHGREDDEGDGQPPAKSQRQRSPSPFASPRGRYLSPADPARTLPTNEAKAIDVIVNNSKGPTAWVDQRTVDAPKDAAVLSPQYSDRAIPVPHQGELSLGGLFEAQVWLSKIGDLLHRGFDEEALTAFGAMARTLCRQELRKETLGLLDRLLSRVESVSPETAGVALIGAALVFEQEGNWVRAKTEYARGLDAFNGIEDQALRQPLQDEFVLVRKKLEREATSQRWVDDTLGSIASKLEEKSPTAVAEADKMLLDAVASAELTPRQSNECLILFGDILARQGRMENAVRCYSNVMHGKKETGQESQQARIAEVRLHELKKQIPPEKLATWKGSPQSATQMLNIMLLEAGRRKLMENDDFLAERVAGLLIAKIGHHQEFPLLVKAFKLALSALSALTAKATARLESRKQVKADRSEYAEKTWNLCLDLADSPLAKEQILPRLLALHYAGGIVSADSHQSKIHEAIDLSGKIFRQHGFLVAADWCENAISKQILTDEMTQWRDHLKRACFTLARRSNLTRNSGDKPLELLHQWEMHDAAIEQFEIGMELLVGQNIDDARMMDECKQGERLERPSEAGKKRGAHRTRLYRAAHAAVQGRVADARILLQEATDQDIHSQDDFHFLYYRASALVAAHEERLDLAGALWALAAARMPILNQPVRREEPVLRQIEELGRLFPQVSRLSAPASVASVQDHKDVQAVDRDFVLARNNCAKAWLKRVGIDDENLLIHHPMSDIQAFKGIHERVLQEPQALRPESWRTVSGHGMSTIPESHVSGQSDFAW